MSPGPDRVAEAMVRAVQLAASHAYDVLPNPPVGCVVLDRSGGVASEGCHSRDGGPHAEEEALRAAGKAARGGTVVLTLEPCGGEGKGKRRPPCARLLLDAGIAGVVYASADPSPHGSGTGPAILRERGVEVRRAESPAADALLARYRTALASTTPWTVAKWAMSLDGRTADARGGSRWITGEEARARAHALRAGCDAVIVGARTAALDDPDLRPRPPGPGGPPLRVVVDGALRLTPESRLASSAREAPVLVATRACPAGERPAALAALGVEVAPFPGMGGGVDLSALLVDLRRRGVRRALIEGGGELAAAAFQAGLVDQVAIFIGPVLFGGRAAPTPLAGDRGLSFVDHPLRIEDRRVTTLGGDLLVEGFLPARTQDGEPRG